MKLKKIIIMLLSLTSVFGWSQPDSSSMAERPPRYPEPGRPGPRPEPRPPAPRPPAPRPPAPRPPAPRPPAPRPPAPRPPAPRPPAPRPPAPRPPAPHPIPPPAPRYEYVYINVSRTLYNYDVLRLNDYVNLYHYYGYQVQAVEIDAHAWDGTQKLSLVVDGRIDTDSYITGRNSYLMMYPSSYVVLGHNTHELSLLMRGYGSVHIDRVVLRLYR